MRSRLGTALSDAARLFRKHRPKRAETPRPSWALVIPDPASTDAVVVYGDTVESCYVSASQTAMDTGGTFVILPCDPSSFLALCGMRVRA